MARMNFAYLSHWSKGHHGSLLTTQAIVKVFVHFQKYGKALLLRSVLAYIIQRGEA